MAGGLRVGEVTALKWRDIDLASGVPRVAASKTEAAVRLVALDANLREELTEHKARARDATPDGYVFPGRDGKRRDRNALRRSVLYPAIRRANVKLKERDLPLIPDGGDGQSRVTFHSLRRTYASLCAEAGADPGGRASKSATSGRASRSMSTRTLTTVGAAPPSRSAPWFGAIKADCLYLRHPPPIRRRRIPL
jgi:integrase